MTKARNLEDTRFYDSIIQTKDKHVKRGMDEDEAKETAWDDRRNALKIFLKEHETELNKQIFEEEEEEDEEEEEERKNNVLAKNSYLTNMYRSIR